MWTTSEMPSTTPLQVTSQGSAPPACMAQLARRDSAELALFAWTVVSDPPWPVLSACSRSAASPPLHLADDDVVGPVAERVPHQVADRYGRLGTDGSRLEPQAVRALDPELERVLDGDDPLLLWEQLDQGVQSVVLPEPVPPDTRMLRRDRSASRAARNTFSGRAPWPTRSSAENARPPNRRMVMATWGLAGGVQMATREPSSSRASRMGRVAGSSPSGRAMWIAAR